MKIGLHGNLTLLRYLVLKSLEGKMTLELRDWGAKHASVFFVDLFVRLDGTQHRMREVG